MNKQLQQVKEFHDAAGTSTPENPGAPTMDRVALRIKLIAEEFKEVTEAIMGNDIAHLAKELADLSYVVNGTILEFGLASKADLVFDAVHASNMSKFAANGKPIYNEAGKVIKGPNYFEPDIESIVNEKENEI